MTALLRGHDAFEDRDFLLTVFTDDAGTQTLELAYRPGTDQRGVTWSPPVELVPEARGPLNTGETVRVPSQRGAGS